MISFNLDFITNKKKVDYRTKELRGFTPINVVQFAELLQGIITGNHKKCIKKGFVIILVSRRPKVEKLLLVQRIISNNYLSCLLSIKRYAILNNQFDQIKSQNRFNYPIAIISKVFQGVKKQHFEHSWTKFRRNAQFKRLLQMRLDYIQQFCYEYQKRQFLPLIFNKFKKILKSRSEFLNHLPNFEQIFQILRVKQLFIAFSYMSIKTEAKGIAELEKQKIVKRDISVKTVSKRNQQINELKRKTTNMKGQVHESTIQNNKKKADRSRQLGTRLMKNNGEYRNLQINFSQMESETERMKIEIERKQYILTNRPQGSIQLGYIQALYLSIHQMQDIESKGKQIYNKIPKGQLKDHSNAITYTIAENTKLKHLINLYERTENLKKSDIYLNAQNENTSLTELVSSLVRMIYFQPKKQAMLGSIDEIAFDLQDLKLGLTEIRSGKIQKRK